MDFDVFKKAVMDEMRERFPNLEFGSREMKKLQGESYEGLMVTLPGSKVSASLNLVYRIIINCYKPHWF